MGFQTLPKPFRTPEGLQPQSSTLAGFERFYRIHLRKVPGQRLRSADLAQLYDVWRKREGAPPIGFKTMKRCMAVAGHQPLHSNGMFYLNVGLASDFPATPDNLEPIDLATIASMSSSTRRPERATLEQQLAAIVRELAQIRRHVVAGSNIGGPGRG